MCKTKVEKAWLVASVIIFITHRLLDASYPGYYSPSAPLRLWLELAMVALSFPLGGLTLFALHSAAFWCDDCRSLEFLFDWSTLLFAGYIQWFWVLPEFLRNRKLTLLDLKQPTETISSNASPAVVEPATPAPLSPATPVAVTSSPAAVLPAAAVAAPCGAFDAATFAPPLTEFDEAGVTALGRVFQAQSPPPTRAPHAHVEAIFPRVS
ncbi:MAG: hypothetical protein LC803_00560 [Acidobacteria bacterium]|nr:hypothetical protein [Acidobacteriota bacterium]